MSFLLILVCTMLQTGLGALQKEEAAFRGGLQLLQTCEGGETAAKGRGQLISVFNKMKEEIEHLRTENNNMKEADQSAMGTSSTNENTSPGSHRRAKRQVTAWDPWSIYGYNPYDDTSTTTTSTTTTRRPKTTSTPVVKTLTDKERKLHNAASQGWDLTIAELCAGGINVNVADASNHSYTPLHLAALGRHLPAAMTLIRCGGNLNGVDSDGNTTLHLTIGKEDHWMTGLLLLAKANPFIYNRLGKTPYQMALTAKESTFTTMFNTTRLAWFGGWRRLNDRDRTARNHIMNGYYIELVNMCLEGWLDPNVGDIDDNRNTAMHAAAVAQWNHPMIMQTLVRCGGNVNVANLQGVTPLHMAISSGNAPSTAALLLHSADPFISNNQGQTPYQLSQQSTNTYIKSLFTEPRFSWYLNNMLP